MLGSASGISREDCPNMKCPLHKSIPLLLIALVLQPALAALVPHRARADTPAPSRNSSPAEFTGPTLTDLFTNPDCARNGTCALKSFKVERADYGLSLDVDSYWLGTKMAAHYQTQSLETLRDYAVVQFIRGCVFTSWYKDGKATNLLSTGREHFGHEISLKHPRWVADNERADPIYGGDPSLPDRHFYYQWNTVPGSVAGKTAHLMGESTPSTPEVYITDDPTGAAYDPTANPATDMTRIRNATLQFQTCIFRTRDVPRDNGPEGVDRSLALHCANWMVSHVYNPVTRQFDSPTEIDPFCK